MKPFVSAIKWICLIGLLWANTMHHWIFPVLTFSAIVLFSLFKLKSNPNKYINSRGYVVLSKSNELEHRYIASQILQRKLRNQEIVHHINGNRTDNEVSNLCVMNNEKHEHFHAWLDWKKEKCGSYPTMSEQKRILAKEYSGILLSGYKTPKSAPTKIPPYKVKFENRTDIEKRLFNVLREERRRLANENNLPAYAIFDDRTLIEFCDQIPDTESSMLKITGMSPIKFKMYGHTFISIIKDFKEGNESFASKKKDA